MKFHVDPFRAGAAAKKPVTTTDENDRSGLGLDDKDVTRHKAKFQVGPQAIG